MTIAKKSGNFLDSEIMRSLETVAIKRGLITPDPIKKEASSKDLKTSDDLHDDLINLVSLLKNRGYEKEANLLEDKIHIHKMAETHLYNTHDETGEDLIDFAHPDGDFEVAPSKDDYGKVETVLSTQKKIIEKIHKIPTGKYAAMDPIVTMSLTFGEAMSPIVRIPADDIADTVMENLVRSIKEDYKGPVSGLHKIANLFHTDIKNEASDWGQQIQEEKQKNPNYKMDEALGIIAEITFARAHSRYKQPLREGTFSSITQSTLKKMAEPRSKAEAEVWITQNVIPYTRSLVDKLKKSADDLFWWENKTWGFSVDVMTTKLSQAIFGYLKTWLKNGLDPESLINSISKQMLANHKLGSWYDNEGDLWVGRLFSAGTAGDGFDFIEGQNISPIKEKLEEKSKAEEKKEFNLSVTKKTLKDKILSLRSIREKNNVHADNRKLAYQIEQELLSIHSAIKSSNTISELIGMLRQSVSDVDNWDEINDITDIKRLLNIEIDAVSSWLDILNSPESYRKEASSKSDLNKKAVVKPPSGTKKQEVKPGGAAYKAVSPLTQLTLKIQLELKKLADAFEKRGGKKNLADEMRNTGAPGYGPKVKRALEIAEGIRAKNLESNPAISIPPTNATLKSLEALTSTLESGKTKASNVLGIYKENIPVNRKDTLSPFYFYRWGLENNLIPYDTDESGEETFNIKNLSDLIKDVEETSRTQFSKAEGREAKVASLRFVKAINEIKKAFAKIIVTGYYNWNPQTRRWKKGIVPTHMRVSDLKIVPSVKGRLRTPGQPGQSGTNQTGSMNVDENGRLLDGVQIEFISGQPQRIGKGSAVSQIPPITKVINLSDKFWWRKIPERFPMSYHEWENANVRSLANLYFGHNDGLSDAEIQLAISNTPYRFTRMYQGQAYVLIADGKGGSTEVSANSVPVVNQAIQSIESQSSLSKFARFLRRMKAEVSSVFLRYSRGVTDPIVKQKLVNRSAQTALAWQALFDALTGEIGREMRSVQKQRTYR